MATRKAGGYALPQRLHFPSDEAVHQWLPLLLDACFIFDRGVSEALRTELRKGRKVACGKGCAKCCRTHETIPVYPLELVGLSWYVTEKLKGQAREEVRRNLEQYREKDPCPFLVDESCSVHPLRPAACRQFIVFDRACRENEDPYYTRRSDVLIPLRKYVDKAFFVMLPFYGITDQRQRLDIIRSGDVHKVVRLMQNCNWGSLSRKMQEYDSAVCS
jgi:uncharacterized protein